MMQFAIAAPQEACQRFDFERANPEVELQTRNQFSAITKQEWYSHIMDGIKLGTLVERLYFGTLCKPTYFDFNQLII